MAAVGPRRDVVDNVPAVGRGAPRGIDVGTGRQHQPIDAVGMSRGNLGLRRSDIDSAQLKDAFGVKNFNTYHNLSWRENLGKGWKMNLGMGYSYNKDNI